MSSRRFLVLARRPRRLNGDAARLSRTLDQNDESEVSKKLIIRPGLRRRKRQRASALALIVFSQIDLVAAGMRGDPRVLRRGEIRFEDRPETRRSYQPACGESTHQLLPGDRGGGALQLLRGRPERSFPLFAVEDDEFLDRILDEAAACPGAEVLSPAQRLRFHRLLGTAWSLGCEAPREDFMRYVFCNGSLVFLSSLCLQTHTVALVCAGQEDWPWHVSGKWSERIIANREVRYFGQRPSWPPRRELRE
ncbi:hypothetical protein Nepgr_002990 [Nepenthes gracilis]|uniref:Uncharacterized protein n=1 Tax=Nepenthes gracilis TaxID=150966 RepID=A0AAD3RYQ0_NEPGR|nr:hypothetical protein Nepgr_002990 [Nepenthes gracilis]